MITIFSNEEHFAALVSDDDLHILRAIVWPNSLSEPLAPDIVTIFSTKKAFAALNSDGSVTTWGDTNFGGGSTGLSSLVRNS